MLNSLLLSFLVLKILLLNRQIRLYTSHTKPQRFLSIRYFYCHITNKSYLFLFYLIQRETLLSNITWKYLRENYKTLKVLPLIRSTEEVCIYISFLSIVLTVIYLIRLTSIIDKFLSCSLYLCHALPFLKKFQCYLFPKITRLC